MSGSGARRRAQRAWQSARRHPVITGTLISCVAVGALAGLLFLSGEWSVARRLLAGAVAGAGTGILVTATKMLG
jgi:NADH:ubiquinone oxidoreductase subunit F (NADH-binding)